MFKRKFWKQENVNFYLGWKNSITSGEFGNPFNSITSYNKYTENLTYYEVI